MPRADVLSGDLKDAHFAAQLDRVVRQSEGYDAYVNSEAFFDLTYPTSGLKEILRETFGHLTAHDGQSVIRAKDSFGGGKTHSLIAVYHLASGARPANVGEFIDAEFLPSSPCRVAAVVGDVLDPVNGVTTSGRTTYTLWGEIAAQLGDDAWAAMKLSDEKRGSPSTPTIEQAIGDEPTIIIIDEVAHYVAKCASSGDEGARRLAKTVSTFLKDLLEVASSRGNLVVILSLATQSDAYAGETAGLEAAIEEAMKNVRSVASRKGRDIQPAAETEIAHILKRRLFDTIDLNTAQAAARAYEAYYSKIADQAGLSAGDAIQMARRIETTYPFHPALVDVLDKRIGTIPNFQRTRGALRLLAETVAAVWASPSSAPPILNAGDIPLHAAKVLRDLTSRIEREGFKQVAESDIVGESAHAKTVDAEILKNDQGYATRAATCVFAHSLEMLSSAGAKVHDVLLGTLRVNDDPSLITDALERLLDRAWHLNYDGSRWRFQTEPNANRIVSDEAGRLLNEEVNDARDQLLKRMLKPTATIQTVVLPDSLTDAPDQAKFHLVVPAYGDVSVGIRAASRVPRVLQEAREKRGDGIRVRRNGIGFLIADADRVDDMERAIRRRLAAEAIVGDSIRMEAFAQEVQRKLRDIADKSKLAAHIAIGRCYRHLYFPANDPASGHLRHVELPANVQGSVGDRADKPWTSQVWETLEQEGKIRDPARQFSADYLKRKVWPSSGDRVRTSDVLDAFWRDHSLPIVADNTAISRAIQDGIGLGEWVYHDARTRQVFSAKDKTPPPVEYHDDTWLIAPKAAADEGLLAKPLTAAEVVAILRADETLDGPALRARLEKRLGAEPTKQEVLETLATVVERGEAAVQVAGDYVTPGALRSKKVGLDTILVSPPPEETDLPSSPVRKRKITEATSTGKAVEAITAFTNDADSLGLVEVVLTLTVSPGASWSRLHGPLLMLGGLTGLDVQVQLNIAVELEGIEGELELSATGSRSEAQQALQPHLKHLDGRATLAAGNLTITFAVSEPTKPDRAPIKPLFEALSTYLGGETVKLTGRVA